MTNCSSPGAERLFLQLVRRSHTPQSWRRARERAGCAGLPVRAPWPSAA